MNYYRKQLVFGVQLKVSWGEDKIKCFMFMDEFAKRFNLSPTGSPVIELRKNPDSLGLSGVLLGANGHLCIHEWSNILELQIDFFSSIPFENSDVIKFISEQVPAEQILVKVVQADGK